MECPLGKVTCNAHGTMYTVDGDPMCIQNIVCVICKKHVARIVVKRDFPALPACGEHRGASDKPPWVSWEWLRDRLKEVGDRWLEEHGDLQGTSDLPQLIREAIGEWLGVDSMNVE